MCHITSLRNLSCLFLKLSPDLFYHKEIRDTRKYRRCDPCRRIAKSNPMKTALNASRLAIAAFIVPYIFAFNPAMLFIDTGVLGVVTIIVTSLIGLFGVAAGLEGYMFANLNVIERLLSIIGGLCLIIPGTVTDLVGIVLVGISAVLQIMKKKKAAVA